VLQSAGGGMVGRRSVRSLGGAFALLMLAGAALAQDRLTAAGTALSQVKVAPASALVQRTVQLDAGEVVTATYVSLRNNNGLILQRTNEGYWVPWSGTGGALMDNRFQAVGNLLTFKVLKQDISDQSFPLTISISYRTSAGLKFGVFEVLPQ
jgi:hypothetical protein